MPQIKVISQTTQSGSITGNAFGDAISLDGALTVSAQLTVSNPSLLSGGSAIFQVSDDALDVTPSNWTNYGSSQNVTASGSLFYEKANPSGNWLRMSFTLVAGSFTQSTNYVVKGPN